MWNAIGAVSGAFTLVAFVVAGAVSAFRSKLVRDQELIRTAPAGERARLVEQALDAIHVDTANLTKEQKYQLLMEQLKYRAERFRLSVIVVVLIAVMAASLTAFAVFNVGTSRNASQTRRAAESSSTTRLADAHATSPENAQIDHEKRGDDLFQKATSASNWKDFRATMQKALSEYSAAEAARPGAPDVKAKVGATYNRLGQYAEALSRLQSAVKLDPSNGWYHNELFLAKACLGEASASGERAEASALDPQNRKLQDDELAEFRAADEELQATSPCVAAAPDLRKATVTVAYLGKMNFDRTVFEKRLFAKKYNSLMFELSDTPPKIDPAGPDRHRALATLSEWAKQGGHGYPVLITSQRFFGDGFLTANDGAMMISTSDTFSTKSDPSVYDYLLTSIVATAAIKASGPHRPFRFHDAIRNCFFDRDQAKYHAIAAIKNGSLCDEDRERYQRVLSSRQLSDLLSVLH